MFNKILIANRGEIGVRIARTARRMGIATVAVYADADAHAWHVSACDEARRLGASPPRDSYLNSAAILDAARRSGAQAIHPGYGFLAENADFAESCERAGLVFVGPSSSAMRALGLKAAAKELAACHGVPIAPGYHGADQTDGILRRHAAGIGFPVLIKPTAGGGGRGLRRVERADDFDAALAAARREASSSFGDARILIEKYISPARHVEVQILADRHGHCVHLYDRDCSVQRRHQKLLEEAPAPMMHAARRREMFDAAIAISMAAGYVGAGTVEFIVDSAGAFYFMEMNARLQVEHPVTEMVTGLDLVEWQLRIAAGEALAFSQGELTTRGHAIEARLCAEDPAHDFVPSAGPLEFWSLPRESPGLRIDSGVRQGDEVTPYYDSLLAKLIVWDETRELALARLQRALARCRIVGVANNVEFLGRVLRTRSFDQAQLDTLLLEREHENLFPPAVAAPPEAWLLAAVVAVLDQTGGGASPWDSTGAWRLNAPPVQPFVFRQGGVETALWVQHMPGSHGARRPRRVRDSEQHYQIVLSEQVYAVSVSAATGDALRVTIDGCAFTASAVKVHAVLHVFLGGHAYAFEIVDVLLHTFTAAATDHGLRAPLPGRVVATPALPGAIVERGAPLLVIEAMKMEHTLLAPTGGRVDALLVAVGDQVAAGAELVAFSPIDGGQQSVRGKLS